MSFLGRHRTIVHDPLTFLCVLHKCPEEKGGGGGTSRWAHIAGRSDGGGRGQLFSMSSTLLSFLSADAQRLTEHTSSSNIPPLDRFVSRSSRPIFLRGRDISFVVVVGSVVIEVILKVD